MTEFYDCITVKFVVLLRDSAKESRDTVVSHLCTG